MAEVTRRGSAEPMDYYDRLTNYQEQNEKQKRSHQLSPRQHRRIQKKLNRQKVREEKERRRG